jgi:uncharacterized protein YjgD (DUF1641 family)
MTVTGTAVSVDERLDQMAGHLAEITGELRRQRQDRERWQDLADDLAPVTGQAMAMVTSRLDEADYDVAALARLAQTLVRDAALFEALLGSLRAASALAGEIGPLAAPAAERVTARLQELEERGYFSFARQSAGMLDTIVTSFTEEDVKLLGDNIVLILQTVRQMTQPEVMGMLNRTALTIAETEANGSGPPPSTFSLLRQMRDPLVRRGLARALATLRAVGAEPEPAANAASVAHREAVANPATPGKR